MAGDARFRSLNALNISVENGQPPPKRFSELANPAPCVAAKTCLSNRVAVARTTKVVFAGNQTPRLFRAPWPAHRLRTGTVCGPPGQAGHLPYSTICRAIAVPG